MSEKQRPNKETVTIPEFFQTLQIIPWKPINAAKKHNFKVKVPKTTQIQTTSR